MKIVISNNDYATRVPIERVPAGSVVLFDGEGPARERLFFVAHYGYASRVMVMVFRLHDGQASYPRLDEPVVVVEDVTIDVTLND